MRGKLAAPEPFFFMFLWKKRARFLERIGLGGVCLVIDKRGSFPEEPYDEGSCHGCKTEDDDVERHEQWY